MALKASEVVGSVRATLDYPSYDTLKPQLVMLKLREKLDHYLNRLNLTDRDWFLSSWQLDAVEGTNIYLVSASQWGRPISCETVDSTDIQHLTRDVPIIDLQDRNLFYEGPVSATVGTLAGNKHSAVVMAFYKDSASGSTYVKVTPEPAQSASYLFWYEPNRPLPPALASDLTFLEQFNNLLVADLSLACIPYTNLDTMVLSEGYYKKRTKGDSIREALQRDFQMYLQTFEEYIQNDRQQKISRKQMWGEAIMVDGDGGYY